MKDVAGAPPADTEMVFDPDTGSYRAKAVGPAGFVSTPSWKLAAKLEILAIACELAGMGGH